MQTVIEGIRKLVVLVLVMELVLQLSPGKQYEPYMKILVGIMVIYSLTAGIFGAFGSLEKVLEPMEDRRWNSAWIWEIEQQAEEITEEQMPQKGTQDIENQTGSDKTQMKIPPISEIHISELHIEEIEIDPIIPYGGAP